MDVLVIAPTHANLPDASVEVAAIERYHNATIVPQPVRDADIAAAIENGPYEIIWWITHGSTSGVLLGGGESLSIDGVGTYLKTSGAKLCVLNTCDSESVATSIISGGDADIICTIAPVEDRDAIRLGRLLAKALADDENIDYEDAYNAVVTDRGLYRYLRAKAVERNFRRSRQIANELSPQEAYRILRGSEVDDDPGLVRTVKQHDKKLIDHDTKLAEHQRLLDEMKFSASLVKPPEPGKIPIDAQIVFWASVGLTVMAIAVLAGVVLFFWWFGQGVDDRTAFLGHTIGYLFSR